MCGIVGYTGNRQAAEVLLEGLGKLEYRGYDSAGMAVLGENGMVKLIKATGKIEHLAARTEGGRKLPGFAASDTPAGQPMENPMRKTRIPMSAAHFTKESLIIRHLP